jgi:hypothetical protein
MPKYLETITKLSGGIGVLEVGGVFICVKNYIHCRELWTDEDFEMTAVEVKGRDPKFTWEIVGT